MNLGLSGCLYVDPCLRIRYCDSICFLDIKLENRRGSNVTAPGFLGKFVYFLKWAQNRPEIDFLRVFGKSCHYFLLEVLENEKFYDSLFSMSGKILVHKL